MIINKLGFEDSELDTHGIKYGNLKFRTREFIIIRHGQGTHNINKNTIKKIKAVVSECKDSSTGDSLTDPELTLDGQKHLAPNEEITISWAFSGDEYTSSKVEYMGEEISNGESITLDDASEAVLKAVDATCMSGSLKRLTIIRPSVP